MTSPEILARLNPKTPDMRMLPVGYANLSPSDIAHAVSMIPSVGGRFLARAAYAGDYLSAHGLAKCLLEYARSEAEKRRWRNILPLSIACHETVRHYISPQRCTHCNGIGERIWGGRKITCQHCNGSTWERVFNADIAKKIGVSEENYSRTWNSRMALLSAKLREWDNECCQHLSRALDNHQRIA
jgi:hypothetical protein